MRSGKGENMARCVIGSKWLVRERSWLQRLEPVQRGRFKSIPCLFPRGLSGADPPRWDSMRCTNVYTSRTSLSSPHSSTDTKGITFGCVPRRFAISPRIKSNLKFSLISNIVVRLSELSFFSQLTPALSYDKRTTLLRKNLYS